MKKLKPVITAGFTKRERTAIVRQIKRISNWREASHLDVPSLMKNNPHLTQQEAERIADGFHRTHMERIEQLAHERILRITKRTRRKRNKTAAATGKTK